MRKLYRAFVPQKRERQPTPQPRPSPDSHAYGLNVIHEGPNPSVDIIAIHGLNGHATKSWTHSDRASSTRTFWLRDLLPADVPSARILSYGYESSRFSMRPVADIADDLVAQVARAREGINALAPSQSHHREATETSTGGVDHVRMATSGILFFGVPRRLDDRLPVNVAAAATDDASPLMEAYRRDAVWLKESNAAYEEICGAVVARYFLESGDALGEGNRGQEPSVDGTDIEGFADTDELRMGKPHGQMIKFPNRDDKDYQRVRFCLVGMVAEANRAAQHQRNNGVAG